MVIGNHTQAIEWCHFWCPYVTCDPDFKRRAGFSATAGLSCHTYMFRQKCLPPKVYSAPTPMSYWMHSSKRCVKSHKIAQNRLPQTPLGSLRRSPDPLIGWGRRYPIPIPPLAAFDRSSWTLVGTGRKYGHPKPRAIKRPNLTTDWKRPVVNVSVKYIVLEIFAF